MSIAQNFPALKPSLNLDFANVKKLDPLISFSRASGATYYDGKTVAKAEENLFTFSEQFDNAAWLKSQSTVTANDTTAPDGTTTADKLNETAITAEFQVRQSAPTSTTFTASVFAKKSERDKVYIQFVATSNEYVFFDLTNGTVAGSHLANTSNTASRSSAITSVGNDWYRCSITVTLNTASAPSIRIGVSDTIVSASPAYAGTAGSGIFIWGAQLEQRSAPTAYTATTTQPITNYIPVLQTASANTARFDHDPVTGESLGLLVEEQRTNLVLRSEDFGNVYWQTASNVTVETNQIIAPDGTLTGDLLREAATTSTHRLSANNNSGVTGSVSTSAATFSCYLKKGTRDFARLSITDSFGNKQLNAYFDLANGAVGTVSAVGGASGQTASIVYVGNGWYRCVVSGTIGISAPNNLIFCFVFLAPADNTSSYLGDVLKYIYIWGAQLEASTKATSYIKTEASQVTRAIDNPTPLTAETNGTLLVQAPDGTYTTSEKVLGDSIAIPSAKKIYHYPQTLTAGQIAALTS